MEHSRNDIFLDNLRKAVLNNLNNEQFGVSELSNEVAISRFQLHRKIKALKGVSISRFIREVRLDEAMKLLKQDASTASEIAYKVGFGSPSYFIKCFHSHFGYPPGEVKKMSDVRGTEPAAENTRESTDQDTPKNQKWYLGRIGVLSFVAIFLSISLALIFYLREQQPPIDSEISIAVLPLSNLSADPNNQFFADGLVEDLLTRLSSIGGFRVTSRTSSDMYKDRGIKSATQIGKELGVSYIIEGSIQREANKARINIQLIDTHNDKHIWSKLFDRDLKDIFNTQSEIAIQIASELNTILTAQQTSDVKKNRTSNIKAFELYQLGRFHWNKRTGTGYNTSIGYFEQAIKEDPNYGLAYAGMGDTYNLMALQGWIDKKVGRDKAVELSFKALELDPTLAEAHNVLASIYTYVDWDWDGAESEYLRALELNPNYSTAHHYYSEYLTFQGRFEEAKMHIEKALQLDPLSFVIRFVSVRFYLHQQNFQKAYEENQLCQELSPDHPWSVWYNFLINYELGNEKVAVEDFKNFGRITGQFNPEIVDSLYKEHGMMRLPEWYAQVSQNSYVKAELYGLIGENEKAMDQLEIAFQEKKFNVEFAFYYFFKDLHTNPRFIDLLKKMGLEPH